MQEFTPGTETVDTMPAAVARPVSNMPVSPAVDPETYIPPNAVRYGMVLIKTLTGVSALAFGDSTIPANMFWPFIPRLKHFPDPNGNADPITGEVNARSSVIPPAQQIDDMTILLGSYGKPVFLDFFKLSQLDDEESCNLVMATLSNPKPCTKYPYALQNRCSTCWNDYLTANGQKLVDTKLNATPALHNAGMDTLHQLLRGFAQAIPQANRNLELELKKLDEPKKGKAQLYDEDHDNILHCHRDMPRFRTSTDSQTSIDALTEAISGMVPGQTIPDAPTMTPDDVRAIFSQEMSAKDQEIARLTAELAAKSPAEAKPESPKTKPAPVAEIKKPEKEVTTETPKGFITCAFELRGGKTCGNRAVDGSPFCRIATHTE